MSLPQKIDPKICNHNLKIILTLNKKPNPDPKLIPLFRKGVAQVVNRPGFQQHTGSNSHDVRITQIYYDLHTSIALIEKLFKGFLRSIPATLLGVKMG